MRRVSILRSQLTPANRSAAAALLEARQSTPRKAIASWDLTPKTLEEAYAVQNEMAKAYGARAGWKIGATNKGARDGLGIQKPFLAPLFARLCHMPDDYVFPASQHHIRVIEAEVALILGSDLPASQDVTGEHVRAATATVVPCIEVVDSAHGSEWKARGGLNVIADLGAHGRWIRGTGEADPKTFDALGVKIKLTVNGKQEREGVGANVDGGCFDATAALARELATQGIALKKGDVISTGTVVVPWPASAGETVVCEFSGLGTAQVRFT